MSELRLLNNELAYKNTQTQSEKLDWVFLFYEHLFFDMLGILKNWES